MINVFMCFLGPLEGEGEGEFFLALKTIKLAIIIIFIGIK